MWAVIPIRRHPSGCQTGQRKGTSPRLAPAVCQALWCSRKSLALLSDFLKRGSWSPTMVSYLPLSKVTG